MTILVAKVIISEKSSFKTFFTIGFIFACLAIGRTILASKFFPESKGSVGAMLVAKILFFKIEFSFIATIVCPKKKIWHTEDALLIS